jgi:hypothetical protein
MKLQVYLERVLYVLVPITLLMAVFRTRFRILPLWARDAYPVIFSLLLATVMAMFLLFVIGRRNTQGFGLLLSSWVAIAILLAFSFAVGGIDSVVVTLAVPAAILCTLAWVQSRGGLA